MRIFDFEGSVLGKFLDHGDKIVSALFSLAGIFFLCMALSSAKYATWSLVISTVFCAKGLFVAWEKKLIDRAFPLISAFLSAVLFLACSYVFVTIPPTTEHGRFALFVLIVVSFVATILSLVELAGWVIGWYKARLQAEEDLVQSLCSSNEDADRPVSTRWMLCVLLVVASLVLVVGWLARSGYYKG